MLITHLYQFFGLLLGCSDVGETGFPSYGGDTSMGNVHKFMDLNPIQLGYFITQVGLSAASFGVATEDVTAVGTALQKHFGYRCAPPETIVPQAPAEIQAICQDMSCPLAANPTCAAYGAGSGVKPMNLSTSGMPTATSSMSATGSMTATFTGAAGALKMAVMDVIAGALVVALAIAV
jgi:hypothetical protein